MGSGSDTSGLIKLSAPATREFWKIAVLYEDAHLLAIDKPARLLTSPDRYDQDRPNLMKLFHRDIERGADWAAKRGLSYLMNAHRLDFETTGVLLLAKDRPTLVYLANEFGSEKPLKTYIALVRGEARTDEFTVDAKLAPHPFKPGRMRVDPKGGKRSKTDFKVLERFRGYSLLECHPFTGRTHQIRVHLRHKRLPIVADSFYGAGPLHLSSIKKDYRQKRDQLERPLIGRAALHAAELRLTKPGAADSILITAPWPKDLSVAVKYLRKCAPC